MPKLDPVDRCIYCGASTGLTDEHIIPMSLGGRLVLPAASCSDCCDQTKRFEQTVARDMYWALRLRLGIKGRRSKERPKTWPLQIMHECGGATASNVEVAELPLIYLVPRLLRPGVREGRPLEAVSSPAMSIEAKGDQATISRLMKRMEAGRLEYSLTFHWASFFRLIAKAGHAYAYGVLGRDTLEFLLPEIVLGSMEHAGHWIGEALPEATLPDEADMALSMWEGECGTYVSAFVTFFGAGRFPTYEAVVGRVVDVEQVRTRLATFQTPAS